MSRRFVLLASFLLLALSGCVTMNDGYYRQGYYSDGGYYYPAEDGYGDYYQGPEDVDYRYYDSYSYSPFWSLDRYSCGAYYSCSPYWNSYYGRPRSGWSLSFGSHWSYGNWGWYGRNWSPWYDHNDYWRRERRRDPVNQLPPGVLSPGDAGARRPLRPDVREPGMIGGDDGNYRPRPRLRPGAGDGPGQLGPDGRTGIGEPGMDSGGRPLAPPNVETDMPRPGYRAPSVENPMPPEESRYERPQPREAPRYQRPEPREAPRYQRPEPREAPRYERPEPREAPRYQRPEPREAPRYERPEPREAPRYERPEPREAPRYERPEPREMRSSSQIERSDDEQ